MADDDLLLLASVPVVVHTGSQRCCFPHNFFPAFAWHMSSKK